jgi:hypothetical protein
MNKNDRESKIGAIEDRLVQKYGELVCLGELAEVLRYPSSGASGQP